ncbi:PorT family protein [candidate division KSB1 bacterium]|nr:PorT family protein [candidate division KSB1 bacterium]
MKRIVHVLLAITLIHVFSNPLIAQISEIGIKGGFNLAKLAGDYVGDETKHKTGFAAGGYVLFSLGQYTMLQIELLYSQKGTRVSDEIRLDQYILNYKVNVSLSYIEIPVLLRYNIDFPSNLKPFIFGGAYLALKQGAETELTIEDETETEDIGDEIKDTDYGIIVGAGAKLNERITLDARYTVGLIPIGKTEDDLDLNNSVIEFTAGFALN